MPQFDVVVEEAGHAVRTVVYVYEAYDINDALELHASGVLPIFTWVDTEEMLDEISETVVDVRLSEDQDA